MKKYLMKIYHSDTALARAQGIVFGLMLAFFMLKMRGK